MGTWTAEEVRTIDLTDDIDITSVRDDGTLRPYVPVWGVRVGDDIYVRSAHGRENGWFRRALRHHQGRVRMGGLEHDVVFEEPDASVAPEIDAAYQAKYARYGESYISTVVSEQAAGATLRLAPR